MKILLTIILGFAFGWILISSQAFSWFRIQEMFHFQSFHMYGLLMSAIATALISTTIWKKLSKKDKVEQDKLFPKKPLQIKQNIGGGLLFGLGWGLVGTCSAPVYITMGLNWVYGILIFIGTLVGAFLYAFYTYQNKN